MQVSTTLCENSGEKNFLTVVRKTPQKKNRNFLDQLQAYLFVLKMQPEDIHTVYGDMNFYVFNTTEDNRNFEKQPTKVWVKFNQCVQLS